jgi:HK97 family phage portal protein
MDLLKIFRRRSKEKNITLPGESRFYVINGQVVFHEDRPETYIQEGFNKNAAIFSIISYATKKFGQIPFRLYKVQAGKEKELARYNYLTKTSHNPTQLKEMLSLRKKALDDAMVENELDSLLQQPNRHQGQDSFLEMIYGFRKLTGEGNIWLNSGEDLDAKTLELLLIPKQNLVLLADRQDPWGILGYQLQFGTARVTLPKENVLMWKCPSYEFDAVTKIHLRGQSPMRSLLLPLQASNAASEREVYLNKNAGVNGVLVDKTVRAAALTKEQLDQLKESVHNRVNGVTKSGNVTTMSGDWAYLQLGMDANQLRLLEHKKFTTRELCAGIGLPPEVFEPDAIHANKKEAKRNWVYDSLTPDAYSLRDELNRALLPKFGFNKAQFHIDCDIMALPDLSEDVKSQVEAIKEAWWLSPNERRVFMNYEEDTDPNMDKKYIPSGLQTMEQANEDLGKPLDSEEEVVNNIGKRA